MPLCKCGRVVSKDRMRQHLEGCADAPLPGFIHTCGMTVVPYDGSGRWWCTGCRMFVEGSHERISNFC